MLSLYWDFSIFFLTFKKSSLQLSFKWGHLIKILNEWATQSKMDEYQGDKKISFFLSLSWCGMVIEASIGSLAVNGNGWEWLAMAGNGWQWCLRLLIGCAVGRMGQRILSCKRIATLLRVKLHASICSCLKVEGSIFKKSVPMNSFNKLQWQPST